VPAALLCLPVTGLLLALALGRWDGLPLAAAVQARSRWGRAVLLGRTGRRASVLRAHQPRLDLPGVLGPLVLLDAEDGLGGRQGLIWDRRTGTLTAVLRVAAVGTLLADRDEADGWVANWGAWLAGLGYLPTIERVAVTVETAPSPATSLADYVASRTRPDSPTTARRVLTEVVDATPRVSADVDTRVSITFQPARAVPRPDSLQAAVAEVVRTLPGLETGLAGCGVFLLGRARTDWIAGMVRAAHDPAARAVIARTLAEAAPIDWGEAGPQADRLAWDHYIHDSGYSVSWSLREAPRQAVTSQVLMPLLAPGRWVRRVSVIYEPLPAEAAVRAVESELQAASIRRAYRRRTRRDDSARDVADEQRAAAAAREEAEGAGVEVYGVYVTTTVLDPQELPAAAADVEQRAGAAKLRLRRAYGGQDVGFAVTLGVGVCPRDLAERSPRSR
jgi:uncharacterized protein with GYD domain